MQMLRSSRLVGVLVAGSLFVSSTGAVAASATSTVPQVNPWAALTAMSGGAPATALCGAAAVAAAAAQPAAGCLLPVTDPMAAAAPPSPTPVPPVEPVGEGLGISPLLLALGALAVGALVYFLLLNDDDDDDESVTAD